MAVEYTGGRGRWAIEATRRGERMGEVVVAGELTFALVGESLYAGRDGRTLWRTGAPSDARLVTNGERAALVSLEAGLQQVEMGEAAPSVSKAPEGMTPRRLLRVADCYGPTPSENGRVSAASSRMERMTKGTIDREMRDLLLQKSKPQMLVEAYFALSRVGLDDLARDQVRRAHNRFPSAPETCLLAAHGRAHEGRWAEAMRLLCDHDAPDPHRARHHAHLLGLATLFGGAPDRALEVWREAEALPGDCPLGALSDFVRRAYGPEVPTAPGPLDTLVRATDAAERALWEDDAATAVSELAIPAAWRVGERQSAARRAYAYLALGREDLEARVALCWFLDLDETALNLPPNEGAWDDARLAQIRRAAREALWPAPHGEDE